MSTAPYLVRRDDEYRLDVSVGSTGRRQLALSDRAEALLVDDLGYGDHDVVRRLTAKVVVLTGGAYRRDARTDPRELARSIGHDPGSSKASDDEVERLAEYLGSVEIDPETAQTVRELVAGTRLSAALSPGDVRSTRDRTNDLRGIAKDL